MCWNICLGRQTLFELGLGVQQRLREVVRQLLEVGRVQLELFGPGGLVDAGHRGELLSAEVQTRPVELGRASCRERV